MKKYVDAILKSQGRRGFKSKKYSLGLRKGGLQRRPVYGVGGSTKPQFRSAKISKETGYVDLANAAYACNMTGTVTLLATVPQGASVVTRVGKKILWKNVQCHGYVQGDTTAVANRYDISIVYDKRPTGATPSINDIYVSAHPNTFPYDDNIGRFKILKRVVGTCLGASGATAADATSIDVDFFLPLKNLPAVFKSAGTGAIGDIETGALYLVTRGINAAGTTDAIFTAAFRTRFLDV